MIVMSNAVRDKLTKSTIVYLRKCKKKKEKKNYSTYWCGHNTVWSLLLTGNACLICAVSLLFGFDILESVLMANGNRVISGINRGFSYLV